MAAGVISVAHDKGIRVPGDLSIIGFDDSPTATHIWPALSTVRWPIREMGMRAARTLVAEFLGPEAKIAESDRRSAERRFGEACVRTCRSWWTTLHEKKNKQKEDNL